MKAVMVGSNEPNVRFSFPSILILQRERCCRGKVCATLVSSIVSVVINHEDFTGSGIALKY